MAVETTVWSSAARNMSSRRHDRMTIICRCEYAAGGAAVPVEAASAWALMGTLPPGSLLALGNIPARRAGRAAAGQSWFRSAAAHRVGEIGEAPDPLDIRQF